MAEAAVTFLLQEIESLLRREWGLDEKIRNEINNLKSELQTMDALLKDADAKGEHHHQVRNWVKQVQDLAYDIEHILDMFAYSMAQQSAHWYAHIRTRHSISDLIDDIKSKLKLIGDTRQRFHDIIPTQATSSSTSYATLHPRIAPLFMEDTETVGIEGAKDMLTSWALQGEETYKVKFVVGMGGSGKTTLVKMTFERVKQDFDCYAWITASKSSKPRDLLRSMFNQFSNPPAEQTPQMSSPANEVDLMKWLRSYLQGKRYLVVLDNLWIKDVWESLSYALPRNCKRGRVIITTRRADIAYSRRDDSTDIHNIQPLAQEHAQELFYNKAFPRTGSCPQRLEGWARNILQICEGLPLGIIEIGQYLSTKGESEAQWKYLHDSLESELTRNGCISNTMKVLFIGYSDLPYHLKFCFLYLSIFPEGSFVKRRRLIRLWIAEGFVREETGKQLEDVGEEYLKKLIERGLIVSEEDFDGRPSSCRAHNLMHKIILSISREDNFLTVRKESSEHLDEKNRRISVQNCSGFNMKQQNNTRARTLSMFYPHRSGPNINFSSLKLLKVLHLEGAAFDTFPNEIEELLLLKYLCLSHTRINSIPKSLGKLQHLETLDLKQTLVTKLPKEVTKLAKLRHLLVCNYNIGSSVSFDCVKGFEIPHYDVGDLKTLQKLSFLKLKRDRSYGTIVALGNLSQLRKLGIIDLPRQDGRDLCVAIQKMKNLQSLNVTSTHKEEILDLQYEITNPSLLHRLYLKGRLEKLPVWISRLHDLVRIRLKWSKLSGNNNPIPILQELSNLLELQLLDAYDGERLEFFAEKFPKLKILELEQMEHLRKVIIMDRRALPSLQKIIIRRCSRLVQVPDGINHLTHLNELILCDMPRDFVNQLKEGGESRHLVHHIQSIRAYEGHSNGQMVSEKLS